MESEISRDRSPKSPKSSLADAIEKVREVHKKAGKAAIGREALASVLGYAGLTGSSLTHIATLRQYGLLDANGSNLSVSPLALRLLHPLNPDQELKARQEAALLPPIFTQLNSESFHIADEGVIANKLIHSGFSAASAKLIARIFKENIAFAKLDGVNNSSSGLEVFENEKNVVQAESLTPNVQKGQSEAVSASIQPELKLPLDSGYVVRFPIGISQDEFDLINGTLQLWKKRIVRHQQDTHPEVPRRIRIEEYTYIPPKAWGEKEIAAFRRMHPQRPDAQWTKQINDPFGGEAFVIDDHFRLIGIEG
jgi:hypothetical protein